MLGEAGGPKAAGCLLQKGDGSLGHQSPHMGQSAWPSVGSFFLRAKQPPGGMSLTPPCPTSVSPWAVAKFSAQQNFLLTILQGKQQQIFPMAQPQEGGQEDTGDLRAESALAQRGHAAHVQTCPLPHCDASRCPPKHCLLQSGFSRDVLCHPNPVPRGPFSLLSRAGNSRSPG